MNNWISICTFSCVQCILYQRFKICVQYVCVQYICVQQRHVCNAYVRNNVMCVMKSQCNMFILCVIMSYTQTFIFLIIIQSIYKVPTSYISKRLKIMKNCKIRVWSFWRATLLRELGKLSLQGDTSKKLQNFKWNPHIVVYHLKGHKRKFLEQIGSWYIDLFGVI